ncbi:MAG TPA: S8 family serine peptidase [Thermoanaerobaculia bacterium]|jgi:subtilisin family serine protease|nr:S8 family serine peptidase [Thermoanaerobaculia bacterium]
MKKLIVVSLALLSIALSARAQTPRRRYLVATEQAFREEALAKKSYTRLTDGYAVELSDEEAKVLAATSGVRYVEPDVERYVSAVPAPHLEVRQVTPWGVVSVHAPLVWFLTRGEGVRVGIIDTGIDLAHPDLQAAYRGGYDFVHNDAVPEEEAEGGAFSHGTRMAGIIAASDNGFGVVGAAPGVSLYVLKIFPKTGGALTSNVIRAVEWAIAQKLDVVSCSFGGETPSKLEEETYARARRANVLVIAAVGNDASWVRYPAAYPSVVGVGAMARTLRIASFSNTGIQVAFVAPGVDLVSTIVSGRGHIGSVTLDDGMSFPAHPFAYSKSGAVAGLAVDCADGYSADFPSATAQNVALVQQAGPPVPLKATNAIAAQAAALIVINSALDDMPMRGSLGSENPRWPVAVSVSMQTGQLIAERGSGVLVDSYLSDYDAADGASMAAPHVAAVAALVRALRPDLDADEVVALLAATATDLGDAGRDPVYGYGLVDAYAAAAAAVPERMPVKIRRRSAHP